MKQPRLSDRTRLLHMRDAARRALEPAIVEQDLPHLLTRLEQILEEMGT